MEEKKTECECPLAGYCNRHQVKKNAHWHKLCQNHTGYFKMWEECRGPGQDPNGCKKNGEAQPTATSKEEVVSEPSAIQKAKNFGSAMLSHAKNGFRNVDAEEQKRRFSICTGVEENGSDKCEFFNEKKASCELCGCRLNLKTKLESSHCPKGLW